ncbi:MAG: DUF4382 domain-containing protein, partial [Gammaproteobacteria bacterium]|nr:DUF4382 domain-containing protein [Gammaproteobacteria bacterium]
AEVWVRFTEVIVHPADDSGDITYTVEDTTDPNNILPYREIELKALVGGKTMLLGEIPLDANDYSWVRLVIDPDNTRIVETSGAEYLVECPSCTQSGFKLNRDFTIPTTGWIDFIIDFDLRQSLTLRRPNQPREDFDYLVRPTLRILDTELASSFIHGIVTDLRTEQVNPATPDACWVYVYEGDAASVTPDDICLDLDTNVCPLADRPLLETQVLFDGVSGDYIYNTSFIYPGLYTVALVCEADDPNIDDSLLFMSEAEVQADAIAGGAQQDLALVDVPILTLLKTLDSNADEDVSGTVTAGDTLTYRMSLGNDGNVTLTNVTVSDPLTGLSALLCGAVLPATLAPAATLDCTATYVVLPADISIVNTATAGSDQAGPVDSSVTVDVVAAP